jgi:hypothetical protein
MDDVPPFIHRVICLPYPFLQLTMDTTSMRWTCGTMGLLQWIDIGVIGVIARMRRPQQLLNDNGT